MLIISNNFPNLYFDNNQQILSNNSYKDSIYPDNCNKKNIFMKIGKKFLQILKGKYEISSRTKCS